MNPKIKILIIEDDLQLSTMYSKKFRIDGYSPSLATNGQEGLEKALKENPDLILLDVRIPIIDGLEVLRRLKNNKKTKDIPIVMLTVMKDEEKINKALSLGALDYLVKSDLTPTQVIEKINKIIKTNPRL